MIEWVSQVLLVIITILIIGPPVTKKIRKLRRYKENFNKIPGPRPGWILGSISEYDVPRECKFTSL
jgi:hypothetical protein